MGKFKAVDTAVQDRKYRDANKQKSDRTLLGVCVSLGLVYVVFIVMGIIHYFNL